MATERRKRGGKEKVVKRRARVKREGREENKKGGLDDRELERTKVIAAAR